MAEVSRPFDSVAHDRLYQSADFAELFLYAKHGQSGVLSGVDNELGMDTPTGYTYSLKTGSAFKTGYWYRNTAALSLTSGAVASGKKRIDRIILRVDNVTNRAVNALVVAGVETAGVPTAPTVVALTDVLLFQLQIDNSSGTPVYTLTDERAVIACGFDGILTITDNTTYAKLVGDKRIYVNAGTAKTVNISAGAVVTGSRCYVKSLGAGAITLRIRSGGTGTGYDVTLNQYEWVDLEWDGTYWIIVADRFRTEKVFAYTTAGAISHTVPAGRRIGKVTVTGGGGAGGGSTVANNPSSGGGAGGTAIYTFLSTPGASLSGSVGAAGTAGTGDGGDGGDSTFTIGAVTPTGAKGAGGKTYAAAGVQGGLGGVGSNGDINVNGGDGGAGKPANTNASGIGGASYWGGGGGNIAVADTAGLAGKAWGSGGSGCGYLTSGSKNGGAGKVGIIVIEYGV